MPAAGLSYNRTLPRAQSRKSDPGDVMTKKALMGALALYLDFINLFVMLLQLTGQRRE